MLPMDRVELTAFRVLGGLGSCFTMFQSMIWLGLSITGIACKYLECGATNHKRTFGYCFYLMYVYSAADYDYIARLNFIKPYYFNIMMWINVALSLVTFLVSAIMLTAFTQWVNALLVKRISNMWTISMILFSIIECVMCAIFIYDIIVIVRNDESKCFKKVDLTLFRSYEPNPSPYLTELKQNLQKLKKKIRKLKKNLLLLETIVDENKNPDHIENPFILKSTLNNHVQKVWRDMFNHNITDKSLQKLEFLPHDEIMKKFLVKKQIDVDAVDVNLLECFDNLTNIKWVKPVESTNITIGRKYNPNISEENPSNTDKMANLVLEYLKSINIPSDTLEEADEQLDDVTETYLVELYEEMYELYYKDLKNKFENIGKEMTENGTIISNSKEEEILMYLKEFFDGLLGLDEVDRINENIFYSLLDKARRIFEKTDYHQKLMNIKEYLEKQYDPDFGDNLKYRTFSWAKNRRKPKKEQVPSNILVNEFCENCAFFVLWPSIVCMFLSLKIGLVWLMNIIIVALVLHYGSKIEVRRKLHTNIL